MNEIKPYAQALSIVVVGRFNPAIFHPLWFKQLDVFSDKEIDESTKQFKGVVHRDIADFQIDWCRINVTEHRYMVSTKMDPYFERLRKLVYSSFELLSHTPVTALGINPEVDYNIRDKDKWNAFGHRILPKDDWREITCEPGMQEVKVKDKRANSTYEGYSMIRLTPSEKVDFGIYIHMNEHFELGNMDSTFSTKNLLDVLRDEFDPTIEKWTRAHNHLISLVGK